MKKIVLLALLVAMVLKVAAQDTVYSLTLKNSYLFEDWPAFDTISDSLTNLRNGTNTCGYIGFGFEAKDSIHIYGVAVSTNTYLFEDFINFDDAGNVDSSDFIEYTASQIFDKKDTTEAYEEYGIGLYDAEHHNLYPISEMVPLNIFEEPDYYHAIGCHLYHATINAGQLKYFPVFELYFDEPVKVAGEFFVMKTSRAATKAREMGLIKAYYWWPSLINCVETIGSNTTLINRPFSTCLTFNIPPENHYNRSVRPNNQGRIRYFFPIIEPDTTGHSGGGDGGGDSVAVREVDVLQRTVALMPNPASDRVRVVSSSGLSLVEAYDAAGVKVAEQRAAGSETALDTRGWAAGQYVVVVHTPIGVVSKKLSVVR
jgi:hypothetical protein